MPGTLTFKSSLILRASKRTWSCNTMTHFAVTVSPPQTTCSQSSQNQEGLPRCMSRRAQSTYEHPHRPKPTFHSTSAISPSNSEARAVSLIPCYQLSFTKTQTGLPTVPPNPLCQHGQQPEDDKHDVLMLFLQAVHLDWAWLKNTLLLSWQTRFPSRPEAASCFLIDYFVPSLFNVL